MVVPLTERDTLHLNETKKFVGNNLKLRIPENRITVVLVGNNCSLKISENYGLVKVIGNNCVVRIADCKGFVEYIGNNGKISIDGEARQDVVTYKGYNGNIKAKNFKLAFNDGKSKSENCVFTAAKTGYVKKNCSLEDFSFIASNIQNVSVLIKNNVKIVNPNLNVKMFDVDSFMKQNNVYFVNRTN